MFQNDLKMRKLILEFLVQGFKTLISLILIAKILQRISNLIEITLKLSALKCLSEIRSFAILLYPNWELGLFFQNMIM